MIAFQHIVQVFHLPVLHYQWTEDFFPELGDHLGQGGCLICINHPREPG